MDIGRGVLQHSIDVLSRTYRVGSVLCLGRGRICIPCVDKFKHRAGSALFREKIEGHRLLDVDEHWRKHWPRVERLQRQCRWTDGRVVIVVKNIELSNVNDFLVYGRLD